MHKLKNEAKLDLLTTSQRREFIITSGIPRKYFENELHLVNVKPGRATSWEFGIPRKLSVWPRLAEK